MGCRGAYLFPYGVDDVGSCVDYLVTEKHWEKKRGVIIAKDFEGIRSVRDDVIKEIEDNDLQDELKEIVQSVWQNVEAQCSVDRKPRYK